MSLKDAIENDVLTDYNGHIWAVCEHCGVKMMQ